MGQAMRNEVKDNTALKRFEMDVEGATVFVTYRLEHTIPVLLHMEVPKALEGRGVGSRFAKAVLDLLRAEGRKAVVVCPFIAAYIRKHPEYETVLAAPLRDPERKELDERLDEALDESFPASDPPAVTPHRH
jgi:predicted GNAT family acetyltransferase